MATDENTATEKLARAFDEYEKEMGIESLVQILASSLAACTLRTTDSKISQYTVETDFVTASVVVALVEQ